MTSEPATANEDTSMPKRPSMASPKNRKATRMANEIRAACHALTPPRFLFKSTIMGMEPVMSMTANSTTNALAISDRLKCKAISKTV